MDFGGHGSRQFLNTRCQVIRSHVISNWTVHRFYRKDAANSSTGNKLSLIKNISTSISSTSTQFHYHCTFGNALANDELAHEQSVAGTYRVGHRRYSKD